ncbi:hypothetical protein SCHPADRAFT_933723 [Schizopora paradoxa]|uniref:Uncharacterized protein n=1 Tax=Schizopora paradoxa TaxID=27342 RepID=A0A0H2R1M8_9AGAM|nr:hypothetical protein SCHPADRAFT_933723 [Schizopora paradoxa]
MAIPPQHSKALIFNAIHTFKQAAFWSTTFRDGSPANVDGERSGMIEQDLRSLQLVAGAGWRWRRYFARDLLSISMLTELYNKISSTRCTPLGLAEVTLLLHYLNGHSSSPFRLGVLRKSVQCFASPVEARSLARNEDTVSGGDNEFSLGIPPSHVHGKPYQQLQKGQSKADLDAAGKKANESQSRVGGPRSAVFDNVVMVGKAKCRQKGIIGTSVGGQEGG